MVVALYRGIMWTEAFVQWMDRLLVNFRIPNGRKLAPPKYSHIQRVWANDRSRNPSSDAHHSNLPPGRWKDETDSIGRDGLDRSVASHNKVGTCNRKDAGYRVPFAVSLETTYTLGCRVEGFP